MKSFNAKDGAGYRTALMPFERATRFARCLCGNSRFAAVEVKISDRAKSAERRHFVAYKPASSVRKTELRQEQADARQDRAEAEGAGYVYILDTTHPGRPFAWCQSVSGEVYETTLHSCDCPDHQYRAKALDGGCKHMRALRSQLAAGTVMAFDGNVDPAEVFGVAATAEEPPVSSPEPRCDECRRPVGPAHAAHSRRTVSGRCLCHDCYRQAFPAFPVDRDFPDVF